MEQAYSNFLDTLKTERTKQEYRSALDEFKGWMRKKSYDALAKTDTKVMEDKIAAYIKELKARELAPLTIRVRLAGIKHFFVINRVPLNWDWIMKFVGSSRIITQDRIYTKDEIRRILDKG